jgi:uncharacterized protein YndB with AHSA1/START domain
MVDTSTFTPKTACAIYIDAPAGKVWQGLTEPDFTKRYFAGFAASIEPKAGGVFRLLAPDGHVHIEGEVVDWSPPRRLVVTWKVVGMPDFAKLPASLVSYDITNAGGCVRLTMTEAFDWDVPDAILSGGRDGWPAILSSLKSLLETGKPLTMKLAPPQELLDAVKALKI